MTYSVYLRSLELKDAQVSYKWRNNLKIWRYTECRPDRFITPELEEEWMKKVMQRKNEKRFAICLTSNDLYIGNVFLTDITETDAQLHIFIGDVENWGGGRAYEAIEQLIDYAFSELNLNSIYNNIHKHNSGALAVAKRLGWEMAYEEENNFIRHVFTLENFEKDVHRTYTRKKRRVLVGSLC